TGIFFETELSTSARKFLFTYKMFSEGYAAVPNQGMQAIPTQLKGKLNKTDFHFKSKVESYKGGLIKLQSGSTHTFDYVINASNNLASIKWLSCENLYFDTNTSVLNEPILGLIANQNSLINNIHFVSDIQNVNTSGAMLSVTIVKEHNLNESELIKKVVQELEQECGIKNAEFLRRYTVKHALPNLETQKYEPIESELWIDDKTILAGDHTCNASLNSAMLSGKMAANAVLNRN
ncbi:MAG: FAD-dependent oxidoreductase, partial [Bacteroidia bacterium]